MVIYQSPYWIKIPIYQSVNQNRQWFKCDALYEMKWGRYIWMAKANYLAVGFSYVNYSVHIISIVGHFIGTINYRNILLATNITIFNCAFRCGYYFCVLFWYHAFPWYIFILHISLVLPFQILHSSHRNLGWLCKCCSRNVLLFREVFRSVYYMRYRIPWNVNHRSSDG